MTSGKKLSVITYEVPRGINETSKISQAKKSALSRIDALAILTSAMDRGSLPPLAFCRTDIA